MIPYVTIEVGDGARWVAVAEWLERLDQVGWGYGPGGFCR